MKEKREKKKKVVEEESVLYFEAYLHLVDVIFFSQLKIILG